MHLTARELLRVVPGAVAVTSGADHIVEALDPHGAPLPGGPVHVGQSLRASVPAEMLDALDAARRSGEPTVAAGVRCTPLGEAGLLLRVETEDNRDRARAAGFQQLTEQLSSAATAEEIGRLTATAAAALIGADACAAYRRGDGSDVLEALHHRGWPASATDPYVRVPVHRGRPMSDAVLTGEPVWLEDAAQWRARYPEMAPIGVSGGHEACACLPLRVDGRDLGAVVFSFYRPRAFDADEREFLVAVAALCAQALDRARLLHRRARGPRGSRARARPHGVPGAGEPADGGTAVGGRTPAPARGPRRQGRLRLVRGAPRARVAGREGRRGAPRPGEGRVRRTARAALPAGPRRAARRGRGDSHRRAGRHARDPRRAARREGRRRHPPRAHPRDRDAFGDRGAAAGARAQPGGS